MSYSPFLLGKLIEAIAHGQAYSSPATWVALLDNAGVELSNVDYSRQLVDAPSGGDPKWSGALTGVGGSRTENTAPISFGTPTIDWGRVNGVALFDASTAGNELMRELLPNPRVVFAGDPFIIPAQALKIRLVIP